MVEPISLKLHTTRSTKTLSPEPLEPAMLEQMEATHRKLARHVDRVGGAEIPGIHRFKNVHPEIQTESVKIMDKILESYGKKPLSRRLLELNEKVASATERYIFSKKEKEFEKKNKIEKQLDDQKSGKNQQGWCQAGGGFGSAVLSIAGGLLTQMLPNTQIGTVLTGLSHMTPEGARALSTWIDGGQLPLQFEQSMYLQTVSADKQTIEGLKRMPDEIRQFILDLVRLELRAVEGISQR